MQEEEVWVTSQKHVCLIAKMNLASNKLEIQKQGIKELDENVEQGIVEEFSNIKVDPYSKQGISDLMILNELNEYNSLHAIRVRYFKSNIYTQVGDPILIAINPYQNMPKLYDDAAIRYYKLELKKVDQNQLKLADVQPHLFKVGQLALTRLFQGTNKVENICSIIISGESGSGKTESTKKILKYLATESKGGLFQTTNPINVFEQQVFASNPLLEAFGNAKTARNDNSSRFGKFIHLYYNFKLQKICSAKIDNYILEKSRVVKISQVERNYHIFYQIISAKIPQLKLNDIKFYKYLQGGDLSFQPDDIGDFKETDQCLTQINIKQEEKMWIYKIVAGVLHLGNIQIIGDANSSSFVEEMELSLASEFFGIDQTQLDKVICHKQAMFQNKPIEKDNGLVAALSAKDSLAKYIYNKLFDWLIFKVNSALTQIDQKQDSKYWIGILDIFGFEIFEDSKKLHTNSFEQLNINFTNEKLQQLFNQHMLETEQVEYNTEKIQWAHIKFPDNKLIIDLIENPKDGIFRSLNDQCFAPNGNDIAFLDSLKKLQAKEHFILKDGLANSKTDPRLDKNVHRFAEFGWFLVKHFAGDVVYNVNGFVEKNKDPIDQKVPVILGESTNPIMRELMLINQGQVEQKHGKNNVLTFFQGQLNNLMDTLKKSHPYFIRCIKPNNNKLPFDFDSNEVRRQIRQAGLLEAIQIRKAGYEIRIFHHEFIKKYRFLVKGKIQNINQMIQLLIQNNQIGQRLNFEIEKKNLQIGQSKVFMKESIRDFMDNILNEYRLKYIIIIQKAAKKFIFRVTIKRNLKKLIQNLRRIRRLIQTYKLKQKIKQNIRKRKILKKLIQFTSNYHLKDNFNHLKYKVRERQQELVKQKLLREQQERELQLQQQAQQQQIQSQQMQSQQLQQSNSLLQSTKLTSSTYLYPDNLNSSNQQGNLGKMMEMINDYKSKLKEERQKRIEAEEKVVYLEKELSSIQDSQTQFRDTIGNQAGLEDMLAFVNIVHEKEALNSELEQLKNEKSMSDKKFKLKIDELTKQLDQSKNIGKQQYEERIAQLEQDYNLIQNEYFKSQQEIEQIEQVWEDKIRKIKQDHQQELKLQENKFKQDSLKSNTAGLRAELDQEKKKRIELEARVKSLDQSYQDLKRKMEFDQFEIIETKDTSEFENLKEQQRLKEIEVLQKNKIIQEQQMRINDFIFKIEELQNRPKEAKEPSDLKKLQETLKLRENQAQNEQKTRSLLVNLTKMKIIQVSHLHKLFNVTEENKSEIYKPIQHIMTKEQVLMQRFQQITSNQGEQEEVV
ncbi:hypothetical protein pb186bvf_003941 [Paramecium bursaria]